MHAVDDFSISLFFLILAHPDHAVISAQGSSFDINKYHEIFDTLDINY